MKDLKQIAIKGTRAEQVMNDPTVRDALTKMRETLYNNIETSAYKDVIEREECYKMLKCISAFERELKRVMEGGKVAESKLEQMSRKVKGLF